MRRETSLIHTSEIKILLKLPSIILVLIFGNVKILIMLMLFLEQARGRPTWPLRATWCPRAPRWWPLVWRKINLTCYVLFYLAAGDLLPLFTPSASSTVWSFKKKHIHDLSCWVNIFREQSHSVHIFARQNKLCKIRANRFDVFIFKIARYVCNKSTLLKRLRKIFSLTTSCFDTKLTSASMTLLLLQSMFFIERL